MRHAAVNAPDLPYRPLLTQNARPATFDVAAVDEHGVAHAVPVASRTGRPFASFMATVRRFAVTVTSE